MRRFFLALALFALVAFAGSTVRADHACGPYGGYGGFGYGGYGGYRGYPAHVHYGYRPNYGYPSFRYPSYGSPYYGGHYHLHRSYYPGGGVYYSGPRYRISIGF